MPTANPNARPLPLTLRLAGLWLIWAAWCSCSGWILSVVHHLDGWGHIAMLPFFVVPCWLWLRVTAPNKSINCSSRLKRFVRRFRRPLPFIFLVIAFLSLISGLLYIPWSFDATTYRLPRLLYWWAAKHWYWIGTLDSRLDFSSCGFEWQMLPIIELTRTDRLLFLLNWLPYLLIPGLTFISCRGLGLTARSAWRWMWLLPSGYCYALQCSGLQNDGYSVNFLLAAISFAVIGFGAARLEFLLMSILAAALLTGAKLSNVPLLLPIALLLLPSLARVRLWNWQFPVVLAIALLCSTLPLVVLSIQITGDWAGSPTDQWEVKTKNPVAGLLANLIFAANDAAQPPVLPGSARIMTFVDKLNDRAAPFINWLRRGHARANGLRFGEMVYEGGCGFGFGLAAYTGILLIGSWFLKRASHGDTGPPVPGAWTIALWSGWIAYAVLLMKLATGHTPRIAAPFYPLLLFSIVRLPRVRQLERTKWSAFLAILAAISVVPVIILTPARPLFPVNTLARIVHKPWAQNLAAKYAVWGRLRDDLAPMREALPPGLTTLGYAGGFGNTSYGLWKPLGLRKVFELGLPLGSRNKPPADLRYAVVTDDGLQQRYQMDLKTWCEYTHAEVVFEMKRDRTLDAHTAPVYESWYLVRFN